VLILAVARRWLSARGAASWIRGSAWSPFVSPVASGGAICARRRLWSVFLRPPLFLSPFYLFRYGVFTDENRSLVKHSKEGDKVFTVEKQPGLADIASLFVTISLGQHKEVIAIVGSLQLCSVGARAD
jgi:hypothetical protein